MYRKKTFTGVYLNWHSLTSRRYKTGLIKCLADRIWRICTSDEDKSHELNNLRTILRRNDYPTDIVEKILSKFREDKARITMPEFGPEKIKRFIKLPYVNKRCDEFERSLKELINKSYPQVDLVVAYSAPMTIDKLFPFKDNVKNLKEKSMVVYSLKCDTCNAEYVGKTERILSQRVTEHEKHNSSACRQHLTANPTHVIGFENVKILDTAENDFQLQIKELLHILKRKPILNKQLGSQSKFEIKTLIIRAFA